MNGLLQRALVLAAVLSVLSTIAYAGAVRVQVTGLRNGDGNLLCALFDSEAQFPGGEPAARLRVPLDGRTPECVFEGVAPGQYAVAVVHDEDRDGKMDRMFLLGIPMEGYGVSNNHTYATHGPRYSESAFRVAGEPELTLNVVLRY